jgi:hypothetical protein
MSQYSRTEFKTLYGSSGSQFPDNTTGLITELIMRTFGENLADSFLSNINDIRLKVSASGTNTYTITGSITAYADGMMRVVKFTNASTGASPLNENGVGVKKIYKDPSTQAGDGDIPANAILLLVYDSALDSAAGGFLIMNNPVIDGGTL